MPKRLCRAFGLVLMVSVANPVQANPEIIQDWHFDYGFDPGWTRSGEWEYGAPWGYEGDPVQGVNGPYVYGVKVNGAYSVPGGPYYLVTSAADCSGFTNITLRFWRYLVSAGAPWDEATVDVSRDEVNWTTVWSNDSAEISDSEWTQVSYDLTSVAANQPRVWVRWGYRVADWTPEGRPGWNIDEVEILGERMPDRPMFRGLWVDAFKPGFKSTDEINELIQYALTGGYNAILPEVMAYMDDEGDGHGAYWDSQIIPRAKDNSGMDSLACLVQKAHAAGLEVHPWLVTYRVSTVWPPPGNDFLKAHPEYLMVPQESMGTRALVAKKYVLDPGSPDVQDYLCSIVREIVAKYPVDGIHWDYIRYESTNAGYPSDLTYSRSGLARYFRATGASETPPPTGWPAWDNFRRRGINELVRRVGAELTLLSRPEKPLRHTASLVPWGNAPSDFTQADAYKACYQDWRYWLEQGYLDGACPMTYYREHCPTHAQWFRNWVDASIGWRYRRHMYCAVATYLNSFDNSLTQLNYVRDQGADGTMAFSYAANRADETLCDLKDPWSTDPTWFPLVGSTAFAQRVAVPSMPWRNRDTAVEGFIYGRVYDSTTNLPLDVVSVVSTWLYGFQVETDGNGYYVATRLPAAHSGTTYTVAAYDKNWIESTAHQVTVYPGQVSRLDFWVGPLAPPTFTQHPAAQEVCSGGTATFTVTTSLEGDPQLRWQKDGIDLNDGPRHAGVTSSQLTVTHIGPDDMGSYQCVATNDAGFTTSQAATLTLRPPPGIIQQPQTMAVKLHDAVTFNVQASGAGLTYRWTLKGADLTSSPRYRGADTAQLMIPDVIVTDLGEYRCVVTNNCGAVTSEPAVLALAFARPDFDADGDVDVEDFGFLQRCFSGNTAPLPDVGCRRARLDADEDVDLDDAGILLRCLTGPGKTARPDCGG